METPKSNRSKRLIVVAAVVSSMVVIGALTGGLLRSTTVAEAQAASDDGAKADSEAKKEKKEKEPTLVAVHTVEQGTISAYITATANLVPENEVKVAAEAEGKVVRLNVEEGDVVSKGHRLLQLDTTDASLAVEKAELVLRNATLGLERAQRMAAERLISAEELDKVRYERDVASHALDESRRRLAKTTVRAPFDARVTLRNVQVGQAVKPGQELFTLADFEPLVARIFLPEREVFNLEVGQDARLTLKAREDVSFRGRILRISPMVDAASGTVKVTVEAVQPPRSVRPGAFVRVGIVRETHREALLIPRPAVIRELQETYVYVADGELARRRTVRLGIEEGQNLQVLDGLQAGETVVTSGQGSLRNEAPIKLAEAQS